MLFNSFEFFLFLAVFVAVSTVLPGGWRWRMAIVNIFSLIFYSWWNPYYTPLLISSVFANYIFGRRITRSSSPWPLRLGVVFNLSLIGVFKYADFLLGSVDVIAGGHFEAIGLALPLGISFYTFEQIAFLVDVAKRRGTALPSPGKYLLFVTFFPHLIAGPIIQPRAFFDQLGRRVTLMITARSAANGLSLFAIGLAKKVLIADTIAPDVRLIFHIADATGTVTFFDAWSAALLFAFQIYFDFSGYSDMAIGLARMFNIRLPQNFNSPYRAASIIDFWRRWHMSLSAFLRDYLYVPLGGNRRGKTRQHLNILLVMFLGGLWHGAGWTFALWGTGHGILIVTNHLWRDFRGNPAPTLRFRPLSRIATFLAVSFLWVAFRAENADAMIALYRGMLGLNGIFPATIAAKLGSVLPAQLLTSVQPIFGIPKLFQTAAVVGGLFTFCNVVPNTDRLFLSRPHAALALAMDRMRWAPNASWLAVCLIAAVISAASILAGSPSEFLYFQF
jgi:alginate O-acetyltransferase complex protein AlgI